MKPSKGRFLWADIIRILAIFLVIATHVTSLPGYVQLSDSFAIGFVSITKTCVPLFVMLSGALLLSKKESYSEFFKRRVKRLLFPWLFWAVIFLLVEKNYLSQIHDLFSFSKVFMAAMESFWFLPMIFSLYIITPALRVFVQAAKLKDIGYIIVIWFVVVSLLPYYHNSLAFPLHVDDGLLRQVVNYLGYYLLGYYITNVKLPKKQLLIISSTSLITGFISIAINLVVRGGSTVSGFSNTLSFISPEVILLSIGIFVPVYRLLLNTEKKINIIQSKAVVLIGSAALGVFFVHGFILELVQKCLYLSNSFPNQLLKVIVVFIISLSIILSLMRVPIIKKFVS